MSESIKLNENKFIDAEGVYDHTLGKTQRQLNGNGPIKAYYTDGTISQLAPGRVGSMQVSNPPSYKEIVAIIPFGINPVSSWAGLAYITKVDNGKIYAQVPSFVTVTDNYTIFYCVLYRD